MPPSRRVLAAIAASALIGAGASAAPAGAAGVAVVQKCVITASNFPAPITVVGSGFTPGSTVSLSTRSKKNPTPVLLRTTPVAANGGFITAAPAAPYNSDKTLDQRFDIFASDGQVGAANSFRQVKLSYQRVPSSSRPSKKIRHIARGFTTGKTVWAHFRHGGKTRATKRLGKASGPCGIVTRKMRSLPAKSRLGLWSVQVDQSRKYSAASVPRAPGAFKVIRKLF